MTQRLYYQDSYTTRFQAEITGRPTVDGRVALILDQTYFYPESGGQPADRGRISGHLVTDVQIRASDGAILHFLQMEGELWDDAVVGEIEWERRFDHMQQHTGQHILSQAFIRVADIETVGFHLGTESVTIDLDDTAVTGAQIEQAELLANQIIWENRPIHIHELSLAQAKAGLDNLTMRKIPPIDGDIIRAIEISDFDLTACGGTHLRHTGEVGLIKIVRLERRRNQIRVDFRCGRRALTDYRLKNSVLTRLASDLTTGYWELDKAVSKLKEELKTTQQQLKQREKEMLSRELADLNQKGVKKKGTTIISHLFTGYDPGQVRYLAGQITQQSGVVALFAAVGNPTQLIFARAQDAPGEMDQLLKTALQTLGSGTGGGSDQFAQGGCPQANPERVQQALSRAERLLLGQIR
jgi:alanyl-tRNA synthetase